MISRELKQKIGRLFMLGVPGERVTEEYKEFCKKYHFGNFVVNATNALTVSGLCAMTGDLRKLALESAGEYPFIAIDQEGGWVTRLYEGAALISNAMSYSAQGADHSKMFDIGAKIGRILRAVGCNIDNAPVLDVNINPKNPIIGTRAYSDKPEKVAELGVGYSRGIESELVITAVKHFPGHGNVCADTHVGVAVNGADKETYFKTELMPFERAFQAGAGAIMTAHVVLSAFSDAPSTLSYEVVTGLLREKLQFEGIVITDALSMGAISNIYPHGEEAVKAILAGCDQLLYYQPDYKVIEKAVDAVYAAVESGVITEERINESIERITGQKEKYKIPTCEPNEALARELIYDEASIKENFEDALSSITCIKNDGVLSELKDKKILCISPICDAIRGVEEKNRKKFSFSDIFKSVFENSNSCISSLDGITDEVSSAIGGDYDVAVIGLFDVGGKPGQLEVLNALRKVGKPIVAVLLKTPYDVTFAEDCNAVITCYGYTYLAAEATVCAMKSNDYRGKLPVDLCLN